MGRKQKRAALPELLSRLEKDSKRWGFFAGHFEWEEDPEASLRAWFGTSAPPADTLRVFGHDGTGSLYAVWMDESDREIEAAPVVHLGSEGAACLLASDAKEFLSLLALDLLDLGDSEDWSQPAAGSPGRAAFLGWLSGKGVAPAKHPARQVTKARKSHRDFPEFVERVLEGDPEPPKPAAATKPAAELPEDPVQWLNQPRPAAKSLDGSVLLDVNKQKRLVVMVSLMSFGGELAKRLRPRGIALLGLSRAEVASRLGTPFGTTPQGEMYRFGEVGMDVSYGGPASTVTGVTLWWIPLLDPALAGRWGK